MEVSVSILGTEYKIIRQNYDEDTYFGKKGVIGYCDTVLKKIHIGNVRSFPNYKDESDEYCVEHTKQIFRHELIHAFLAESGIDSSSINYDGAWATNEEMIDWFALQLPKIQKELSQVVFD
ncbi:MAG: hypothetical protein LBF97_01670 [Elusimicrobiota bacterium]|jgi:hypothetical protein|nr:hypothetical protein [Elusimicrobiota bacterium]